MSNIGAFVVNTGSPNDLEIQRGRCTDIDVSESVSKEYKLRHIQSMFSNDSSTSIQD